MAKPTATPLAVWAAVAVGVAGVSLAAMSDDRHGSRALARAGGSLARVEPPALSPETIAAVNVVQEDRAVTRARQAVTLFRKRDTGYAEARLIAFSMVNDLVMEMAIRHQQGRKISGSWLDDKLAQKKYQRVTFTDLFEAWAKLTAQMLDTAR